LFETAADFVCRFRADRAGDFDAVFEENGGGPEFNPEGTAEGAARAIFDFDVLDGRELSKRFRDVRRCGLTVAAPCGSEFEKDWAIRGVDLFAGWTRILVFG
jgi:hypothetical protein